MSFPSLTKASLAAALAVALGAASAAAADPTPAAIGYALTILTDIGMKPAFDRLVPSMLAELEREVLATNPQLRDPLHEATLAVTPEFVASEENLVNDGAKFLAGQMTEDELKQVAAFYESPAGKKFVIAQAAASAQVAALAGPWRQKMSTDALARVREEMKKKGFTF